MPANRGATAMLWYKAWRESRATFLISVAVIAGLCGLFTVFQAELRSHMGPTTYVGYVYLRVYAGVIRSIFLILAAILGLGGLGRERAHGTLGFTLALPVHRTHHVYARAIVGVVEILALAAIPVVLVPLGSAIVGERYPWTQALGFAALWLAIGGVVFAASVAISAALHNDYVALVVALVAQRLIPLLLAKLPGTDRLQIHDLMSGRHMDYLDPATHRLIHVPWTVLAGAACACTAFVWIAARLTARERLS